AFATCTGLYNSKSASLNISGLVGPPVSFTRQKADACTGEKDKAIWTSGGESRLNSASYKCGNQCAGSAACISQSEGYSTDCLISCATSECLGTCKGEEACQACIDKTCGAAFATCTGLYNSKSASLNISGLVGPPVSFTRQKADACTGEKDKAIWTSGGESRLNSASYKCGNQCAGENSCSAACISQSEGYSTDCSSCMGSLISCATSECLGTCKGEEACQACIDKTCGAAFATCTGLYNSKSASLNISGLVGPPVSFTRQKADACTGEKDKAIWTSGGESRLNSASYKCGNQCAGENSCLISCATSECLGTCKGEEACQACIDKTCGAAFVNCTGLNFSSSFAATASAVSKTLLLEESELSLRAENASKSGAACMGKSDQMIWTGGGEVEFGEVAGDCSEECLGNALCAAQCLHVEEGYSPNCSFCMGGLVNCVASQCYGACNDLETHTNSDFKAQFVVVVGVIIVVVVKSQLVVSASSCFASLSATTTRTRTTSGDLCLDHGIMQHGPAEVMRELHSNIVQPSIWQLQRPSKYRQRSRPEPPQFFFH
ncbi:unnamed protein product, partial [Polarella glacialis]